MLKKAGADLDREAVISAATNFDTAAGAGTPVAENNNDYFVERDGTCFAGTHVLLDLWDAQNLTQSAVVEAALRAAAEAAGATVLHVHVHHFGPSPGISGVAVLAESHISIHTWPERGFAALDVFMCGGCDPLRCVPVLKRVFAPGRVRISAHKRGIVS